MKLEEVLPAFRAGKGIKRQGWDPLKTCFFYKDDEDVWEISGECFIEDDWEIEEDKKEVLKEKIRDILLISVGFGRVNEVVQKEKALFEFIDSLEVR